MRLLISVLLILPLTLQSKEYKNSKMFGVIGISTGILAVMADVGVETFYDKYEKAKDPNDCIKYRNLTQRSENIRDGSFYLSALSFAISSVFLLFEKDQPAPVKKIGLNSRSKRYNSKLSEWFSNPGNKIGFGFGRDKLWIMAKKSF
jgi:hypothetical protein